MAGCVLSGFSLATNYVEIFEYATLISLMQVIFFGLVIYAVFIPFDYVILQWGATRTTEFIYVGSCIYEHIF